MPQLSDNAKKIIKDLYAINGETPDDVFKRGAREFATNDKEYELAYRLQKENIWRANTPLYFNAGTDHPMYSACWVVGLEDTMSSIYDIANVARKIFQHGAGIGIPVGNLREKDAFIYEGKTDRPPTGKSSGPISFMKLYDAVGETTKSGGRARRAAILCSMQVWHPDIMEFISCKEIDGRLSNMNISVAITDEFMRALDARIPFPLRSPSNGEQVKEVVPTELWDKLVEMAWKTADPGVLFIDTINRYNPLKKIKLIEITNPCVIGDTIIAVADGRNYVSIKQLAEEGKDVPVYCKDNNGITKIKMMRNPRITGYKQKIYSVNFDDGSSVRCTGNHKFLMKDGSTKEAKDLLSNDSVLISAKWKATFEEIIKNSNSKSQEYWLLNDGKKNIFEHRFIYEQISGAKIPKGYVVHHKDYNGSNNNFDNLEVLSKEMHDNLHDISGDKNPMRRFPEKNIFNNSEVQRRIREKYHIGAKRTEETKKKIGEKTKERFLDNIFRQKHSEAVSRSMKTSDSFHTYVHDRAIQHLEECKKKTNLECYLDGNTVMVKRKCEWCNKEFNVLFKNREQSFCSYSCSIHSRYKIFSVNETAENHKVVSVIENGYEDVYNGTVDEFHNFGIVLDNKKKTITGREKIEIVYTLQCGEQPLWPFTSCNLSSINVAKFVKDGKMDFDALYKTAYDVMGLMDNIIDKMIFPDERFKENVLKYRPVGIGIMGLADAFFEMDVKYDGNDGKSMAESIMMTITTACVEKSADLAAERGPFHDYDKVKDDVIAILSEHTGHNEKVMRKVRKYGVRNVQFTTCPPTGTTALTADASYGIEPAFGLVFQKTLSETGETINIVNPVFKRRFEKEEWYNETLLDKIRANGGSLKGLHGVPKKVRDVFVTAHDIRYRDRIDIQASLQKYCSSGISSTVNLPNTTTQEEVSELYKYAYEKGLKGITIYRDGCKRQQPITFKQAGVEVQSNFVRPSKLPAQVYTLETGNGKLYVTVTSHNNRPVEIFMTMGKSGQLFNVFTEALGRSISIALQHGVPVEEIIKTMKGINSDRPWWFRFEETDKKPAQILSIPDGLAKLLERYYTDKSEPVEENYTDDKLFCTKCGTYSVIIIEGCKTCLNCSESACS